MPEKILRALFCHFLLLPRRGLLETILIHQEKQSTMSYAIFSVGNNFSSSSGSGGEVIRLTIIKQPIDAINEI